MAWPLHQLNKCVQNLGGQVRRRCGGESEVQRLQERAGSADDTDAGRSGASCSRTASCNTLLSARARELSQQVLQRQVVPLDHDLRGNNHNSVGKVGASTA